MYQQLQIGKIVNVQGVRGEVRVIPLTDNPERYNKLEWVYIDKNGIKDKYYIESVKFLKKLVVLKFKGIDSVEAAETLRNTHILIDRKDAVKLPEDSFFICDLIGLKVIDEKGCYLGELVNVLHTGSNDVYAVKGEDDREILIPALKSVVSGISFEEGKMSVIVPKGLLDDDI